YVEDARAHQARAKEAGAEIVLDIKAETSAGRGYSCRDLEGHIWNFGTYDPWDLHSILAQPKRRWKRRALAAVFLLVAAGGGALYMNDAATREVADNYAAMAYTKTLAAVEAVQTALAEYQKGNETGDSALTQAREQLAKERIARLAADRHVKDIREQLAQERR